MEHEHTIHGLVRKRAELAGQLEHHQTTARQLIIDLDNIDATIRLFKPDIVLSDIRPRPLPPKNSASKGEVASIIFAALRESPVPMDALQLAKLVMAERGIDQNNKKMALVIRKRVSSALRHQRNRGILKSTQGAPYLLWEVAR